MMLRGYIYLGFSKKYSIQFCCDNTPYNENKFLSRIPKFKRTLSLSLSRFKITTRSQKRKVVEELVSAEIETPLAGNSQNINPVAGTSKSPKVHTENLRRNEIYS